MRRHDPFDRTSLAASIAVHVVVLVLAVWTSASARPPLNFVTYQVDLVSPPPAVQAPEPAPAKKELVVEAPEPTPPEPEEKAPVVEEKAKPKPPEPKPKPPREEPEEKPAEKETPATTDEPTPREEKPKESGEGINVRLEGLRRDYPAYYDNIIRQIHRCFRWTQGGNWETTVYFVIKSDGTVSDMDFVKKSGSTRFDFEAMGAVDCAGNGRFGPLPKDLPFDVLPIQFSFRPQGGVGGPILEERPTSR
ncbi:MAG: TonB C-terminal domain-containing protein [Gemmatimonadota bacterium]|jgi:protein TonB